MMIRRRYGVLYQSQSKLGSTLLQVSQVFDMLEGGIWFHHISLFLLNTDK